MKNRRFQFRFEAVKRGLDREHKMAEMYLIQCRQQLQQCREELVQHHEQRIAAARDWNQILMHSPEIAVPSQAGFALFDRGEQEIQNRIAQATEMCGLAEQHHAKAEQKLKSIERIETGDREAFDEQRKRREQAVFQDEVLAPWNRTV